MKWFCCGSWWGSFLSVWRCVANWAKQSLCLWVEVTFVSDCFGDLEQSTGFIRRVIVVLLSLGSSVLVVSSGGIPFQSRTVRSIGQSVGFLGGETFFVTLFATWSKARSLLRGSLLFYLWAFCYDCVVGRGPFQSGAVRSIIQAPLWKEHS